MSHTKHLAELLAPAGNWDCARAAVAAGADAIYFGLPSFNARLRAENFTVDDLEPLMDFLHRHGVKGFLTMNTLIFTGELEAASKQLEKVAAAGVDALIIQDLGLAEMARHIAPEVELHASTQMTITSPEGLAFIESIYPLERAVLARELSVREIERFQSRANELLEIKTPLEVFVHGALCVAYSGQCLTSEALGQRSANRGECAQACRMPYEIVVDGVTRDLGAVRYLLSPQDLAAVDFIPQLISAGVKSFKIEGRLKSPEYVAAVTRVYRRAIDAAIASEPSPITKSDRYALEMTFSRGLSTGWLGGTNHPYLTHGRYGKKRGPLLGEIAECAPSWIRLAEGSELPVQAGDGVVFDAGENRDFEQGARIWRIEGERLIFHPVHSGLDFSRIRPGQTLYKTSDPQLDSELKRFWKNTRLNLRTMPIHLTVRGAPQESLELECNGIKVTSAEPIQHATNHPLTTATLSAQLGRLGGTHYQLESLENLLVGDCHFPLSAINQLRRDLVEQLDAQHQKNHVSKPSLANFRDLLPEKSATSAPDAMQLSVLCRTQIQLEAAVDAGVDRVICDYEDPRRYRDAVQWFRSHSKNPDSKIILATPRILKSGEIGYLKLIEKTDPDGLLLRNLSALHYYENRSEMIKIGDFSLNVANPISAKLLKQHAALDFMTVSYDLNIGQVLELLHCGPPEWFELTLHQHIPMFHMEHCVFCTFLSEGTTYKDCGRPCEKHEVHLRDRVGQLHRLQADVGCRNTLFNGKAQSGARYLNALKQSGLRRFRIELLDEDHQASSIIQGYQKLLGGTLSADDLLGDLQVIEKLGVTEGTLAESF